MNIKHDIQSDSYILPERVRGMTVVQKRWWIDKSFPFIHWMPERLIIFTEHAIYQVTDVDKDPVEIVRVKRRYKKKK